MMSNDEWENLLLTKQDFEKPVLFRAFSIKAPCMLRIVIQGEVPVVAGSFFIEECQAVPNVYQLQQDPHFQRQPLFVKQAFLAKTSQKATDSQDRKKKMNSRQVYRWVGDNVMKFENPVKVLKQFRKFQPRPFPAMLSDLLQSSLDHATIPAQSLRDTARHYIQMLPADKLERLEQRVRKLDGKVLTGGSTCSGSDVAMVMLRHTLDALNEHFRVPWQMIF